MINLKHIGLQVHPKDVNDFYLDVLNGNLDGNHKIQAEQGARLFDVKRTVSIKYLRIGDINFELFLFDGLDHPSFHHICVESKHPELIFKNAVERGYSGRSIASGERYTYFIKDRAGNIFELKSN